MTEASETWTVGAELVVRLGSFFAIFAAMVVWEVAAPRRGRALSRWQRWPGNLGITVANAIILRLLFPTAAIGIAAIASQRGWGLLQAIDLPGTVAVVLAVLALDFIIYGQHRLFHAVPWLWRLHRMHHADLDVDVSTGTRFHPIEIVLSMLIKFAAIVALGAPPLAVLIFEVVLNATSLFNHANIALPPRFERWLRLIVVTPDMHRVHHSVLMPETNSNFGFNLPWWDRLLGSYRAEPAAGHGEMSLGIERFREAAETRIDRLLTQPFR